MSLPLDTPQLLALALVAIYLADSIHWLALGEAVVVTRRAALSRLSLGGPFELGGRRPYLPNPLTPFWPEMRVVWLTAAAGGADPAQSAQQMQARAAALAVPGILSGVCAAAIAAGGPVALLLSSNLAFLTCAGVCLLCTLAISVWLLVHRQVLGLSLRQWLYLTLIALICLPTSPNLARAAARLQVWTLPAHRLAQLTLTAAEAGGTRAQLLPVLREAQRYVPADSAAGAALAEQLRLMEEAAQADVTLNSR
jgi:hypothetical protein